jgi:hypothetical protein
MDRERPRPPFTPGRLEGFAVLMIVLRAWKNSRNDGDKRVKNADSGKGFLDELSL